MNAKTAKITIKSEFDFSIEEIGYVNPETNYPNKVLFKVKEAIIATFEEKLKDCESGELKLDLQDIRKIRGVISWIDQEHKWNISNENAKREEVSLPNIWKTGLMLRGIFEKLNYAYYEIFPKCNLFLMVEERD